MKKNFTIEKSVEVWMNDTWMDLHNCYKLEDIIAEPLTKTLTMIFKNLPEYSIGNRIYPKQVQLCVRGISFLQMFILDANHLDEIGYKGHDDFNVDYISGEKHWKDSDHLFLRLVRDDVFSDKDEYIRVYGESAEISVTL